jgi:L,D-peptidoglycan transpeptidase YkuD (ErfK/YbiS/YcfS/YnhG family)
VLTTLFTLLAIAPLSRAIAQQSDDIWIMIDTKTLTLSVMEAQSILRTYHNIAIGSNGPTWAKRFKDEKTPLGDFRITAMRTSERFHLFLPIDYPTMDDAKRALQDRRIGPGEYEALHSAWKKGKTPPQNTSLGGHLGIHGIGAGSMEIHNNVNWTNGCIALTNDQVEELAKWVTVGTRVKIR